jgi:hypothetical protein
MRSSLGSLNSRDVCSICQAGGKSQMVLGLQLSRNELTFTRQSYAASLDRRTTSCQLCEDEKVEGRGLAHRCWSMT